MSKRIVHVILEDILECVGKMLIYTEGMSFTDFLNDSRTREAVYRNLEVMGEAAGRLPIEFREQNSSIDWRRMIGLRAVLIHNYDGIDDHIVWNIIQEILPGIREQLQNLKV